jgi:hypothetical protein
VRQLVAEYGTKRWSHIATFLPGRLGKQCRERWYNHLDPTIKRGPWTPDEDYAIVDLQHRLGNKWAEIAGQIQGRCAVSPGVGGGGGWPLTTYTTGITRGQVVQPLPVLHACHGFSPPRPAPHTHTLLHTRPMSGLPTGRPRRVGAGGGTTALADCRTPAPRSLHHAAPGRTTPSRTVGTPR